MGTGKNTKFTRFLKKKGMNMDALAKDLGVKNPTLSLFNGGYHNYNIALLKRLVIYYDCTPNDLIDFGEWKEVAKKKRGNEKYGYQLFKEKQKLKKHDIEIS